VRKPALAHLDTGDRRAEAVFSAALVAAGAIALRATFQIEQADQHTRTFPLTCSLIVLAGGLTGLVRCFIAPAPLPQEVVEEEFPTGPDEPVGEPGPGLLARGVAALPQTAERAIVGAVRLPEHFSSAAAQRVPRPLRRAAGFVDALPKPFLLFLAVLAYIWLLPRLHYRLATFVFALVLMWVLDRRLTTANIVFSIATSFILYWLFEHVLTVRLP
jgi:hypothetical protein